MAILGPAACAELVGEMDSLACQCTTLNIWRSQLAEKVEHGGA